MSHPSLGLPPRDMTAGAPAAAAALLAARDRLAARAFEAAVTADPTLTARFDEVGLQRLLRDTGSMLDSVAAAVASGDPGVTRQWAEGVTPAFRRRRVSMDDLVTLAAGLRSVVDAALCADGQASAAAALDEAIAVFRWHRRLGGDTRQRNRILAAIYKGA